MITEMTQAQFERGDAYGLSEDDYKVLDNDGNELPRDTADANGDEVSGTAGEAVSHDAAGSAGTESGEVAGEAAGEPGEGEAADASEGDEGSDSGTEGLEAESVEEEAPQQEAATGHMIPKFRYDHQKTRNERLERELNELKAKMAEAPAAPQQAEAKPEAPSQTPAEPDRVTTLLNEKMQTALLAKNEALIAGDAKKASELDLEVMGLQRELNVASTPKQTATTQPQVDADTVRQQVRMEMMLDDALDNAIGSYAELNESSGKYNEQTVNRIVALQQTFIQSGMTGLEAFNEAVDTLASTLTPLNAPEPKAPAKRLTDVKKNIEAAKRQPPSLTELVGADSDKAGLKDDVPDSSALSQDEFDKLPNEVRRRMRGDFVSS